MGGVSAVVVGGRVSWVRLVGGRAVGGGGRGGTGGMVPGEGGTYAWARRRLPVVVRARERSVMFGGCGCGFGWVERVG